MTRGYSPNAGIIGSYIRHRISSLITHRIGSITSLASLTDALAAESCQSTDLLPEFGPEILVAIDASRDLVAPTWRPDGQEVLFSSARPGTADPRLPLSSEGQIFKQLIPPVGGTDPIPVATFAEYWGHPRFSPRRISLRQGKDEPDWVISYFATNNAPDDVQGVYVRYERDEPRSRGFLLSRPGDELQYPEWTPNGFDPDRPDFLWLAYEQGNLDCVTISRVRIDRQTGAIVAEPTSNIAGPFENPKFSQRTVLADTCPRSNRSNFSRGYVYFNAGAPASEFEKGKFIAGRKVDEQNPPDEPIQVIIARSPGKNRGIASISPNGRHIAFVEHDIVRGGFSTEGKIYVASFPECPLMPQSLPIDEKLWTLVAAADDKRVFDVSSPSWDATSRFLVYQKLVPSSLGMRRWLIFARRVAPPELGMGPEVQVSGGAYDYYSPAFSPSGPSTYVAYVAGTRGTSYHIRARQVR